MPKHLPQDWKFFIMLSATIAGVVGPIWLWRAGQATKSISMELVSQISLSPTEKDVIPGLQIAINGVQLADPFYSVVRIVNAGNKPIPSADFESPLELRSSTDAKVVGARIAGTSPQDIGAEIVWDKRGVRLKPTLLNPRDSITVAIITSGGLPNLSPKSRIIGVSSVQIVDATVPTQDPKKRWFLFVAAIVFAVLSTAAINRIEILNKEQPTVSLRRRTVYAVVAVTATTATVFWALFLNTFGVEAFLPTWLSSIPMFFIAFIIGSKLDHIPKQ